MATAAQLEAAGVLHKYDPALEDDEQELRIMWTSQKLKDWIEKDLPKMASQWDQKDTPPDEQFYTFMATYGSGLPLVFEKDFKAFQPRAATPLGDGVWYLKMPDIRLFGWFWKKDCFIGVVAHDAGKTKLHQLYEGFRGEVVRYRDALDLDAPKYIPGIDPNDVISNYSFA